MKFQVGDKVIMKDDVSLNFKQGLAGKVVRIVCIIGDAYWVKPHGLLVADKQIEGRAL